MVEPAERNEAPRLMLLLALLISCIALSLSVGVTPLSFSRAWRDPAGLDRARIPLPAIQPRTTHGLGASPPLERVAVRSLDRIVIIPVHVITRLEAEDNYVRIWADRMYLHKETLGKLCERLDPRQFLRVHRSHAVRIDCVRELVPRMHGEFLLRPHRR